MRALAAACLLVGCTAVGGDLDFDEDGFLDHADCDPEDPTVHPGAIDPFGDGIDGDCDGQDGFDGDGDGFHAEDDCDDGDASIHPDAEDLARDLIDQDCDGMDLLLGERDLCAGDRQGELHAWLGGDLEAWEATGDWALAEGLATCEGSCSLRQDYPVIAQCWQISIRFEAGPDCSEVAVDGGVFTSVVVRPDEAPYLFVQDPRSWPGDVQFHRERPQWLAVSNVGDRFYAAVDGVRPAGTILTGTPVPDGDGSLEIRTEGSGCRVDRVHIVSWN